MNWVLWASQFNYWIQGCDPQLATVVLVILIQHFLGILCATELQATIFMKILFPGYMGIPILVSIRLQEIFLANFQQPKFMENLIPISMHILLP